MTATLLVCFSLEITASRIENAHYVNTDCIMQENHNIQERRRGHCARCCCLELKALTIGLRSGWKRM